MRAAQLKEYGDPVANVDVVDIGEPAPPGPNEVLIQVLYAAVNPADLLLAMGYYAVKPSLPSVIGNEGVGKVLEVGAGVFNVKVGDLVAPPLSSFSWRERMVIPAGGLVTLPANADPRQLAIVAINPVTAALLLSEFKPLNAGDWLVQNAANSGVGRAVIALARERGLKTINIVRRAELVAEWETVGANVVLLDGEDIAARVSAATGGAEVKFGLDALSGPGTGIVASILSPGSTMVTYGALTYPPISVSAGDVVYKALTIRGFFLGHPQHAAKFPALIKQAGALIEAKKLSVPIAAVYPLSAVKEALAHVQRGGKVLLDIAGH